jgi:hypothetical protein
MATVKKQPAYVRAGFKTPYAYSKARKAAREWSTEHSRAEQSRYEPSYSPEKFRAYYDAFVSQVSKARPKAKRFDKKELQKWLVDFGHYYTKSEYEDIYSKEY